MPLFRSTRRLMSRIETRKPGQYREVAVDRSGGNPCPYGWADCDCRRQHYEIILPNLQPFWTNMRAGNCDHPGDRRHRCWSLQGPIRRLTVGPSVGLPHNHQGSIVSWGTSSRPYWHGYLRNGEFMTLPS